MGVPIDRGLTQEKRISSTIPSNRRVEMGVPIDRGLTHHLDRDLFLEIPSEVEMGVPIDRGLTQFYHKPRHSSHIPSRNGCPDR